LPLTTLETVARETPATRATSSRVGAPRPSPATVGTPPGGVASNVVTGPPAGGAPLLSSSMVRNVAAWESALRLSVPCEPVSSRVRGRKGALRTPRSARPCPGPAVRAGEFGYSVPPGAHRSVIPTRITPLGAPDPGFCGRALSRAETKERPASARRRTATPGASDRQRGRLRSSTSTSLPRAKP